MRIETTFTTWKKERFEKDNVFYDSLDMIDFAEYYHDKKLNQKELLIVKIKDTIEKYFNCSIVTGTGKKGSRIKSDAQKLFTRLCNKNDITGVRISQIVKKSQHAVSKDLSRGNYYYTNDDQFKHDYHKILRIITD